MKIDMKPVKSSHILEIGHNDVTNTLSVKFKDGKTYQYDGVSTDLHKQLMASDSKGRFLQKHITHSQNKRKKP